MTRYQNDVLVNIRLNLNVEHSSEGFNVLHYCPLEIYLKKGKDLYGCPRVLV